MIRTNSKRSSRRWNKKNWTIDSQVQIVYQSTPLLHQSAYQTGHQVSHHILLPCHILCLMPHSSQGSQPKQRKTTKKLNYDNCKLNWQCKDAKNTTIILHLLPRPAFISRNPGIILPPTLCLPIISIRLIPRLVCHTNCCFSSFHAHRSILVPHSGSIQKASNSHPKPYVLYVPSIHQHFPYTQYNHT